MSARAARIAARTAGLAGLLLGLWVSFHYAFATWTTESDAAYPYVMWHGLRDGGWQFVTTFRMPPDNWLAWPLPLLFGAFATFGDTPPVAFAVGWLLFAGSAAVASLIVRQVAGRGPALACAVVLLLSNRGALGELGFLTYPVSHNATLLPGLLATLGALRWLAAGRRRWLVLAAAMLLVGGLADPWIDAAFGLPLLLAAMGIAVAFRARRGAALALAAVVGLTAIATHTRLFGALPFLPSAPLVFAPAEGRGRAVAWLGRLAAMWFDAVPGWGVRYAWIPDGVQTAVDLLPLLAAAAAVTVLAVREVRRDPVFALLCLTGGGSIGAVCGAYVLLDFPQVISTGRFFMAAYVFAAMLFAATVGRAWGRLRPRWRVALAGYAVLLPLAGLASAPAAWATLRLGVGDDSLRRWDASLPAFTNTIPPFAAFLLQHKLRFGYGGYWLAEANAVAWVTGGAVVVRPVNFDPGGGVHPFYTGVSPGWFTGPDGPPDDPTTFLVIAPGIEGCADVPRCTAAAAARFGPALDSLRYGDATVLVWNHRLFARPADPAPR